MHLCISLEGPQLWRQEALSTLDVLVAFAAFAASCSSPTCRPALVQPASGAILDFQQLWNPCAVAGGSGAVIPNDMALGDRHARLQCGPLLLFGNSWKRSRVVTCTPRRERCAAMTVDPGCSVRHAELQPWC